jgi:hypothetical protein
MSDVDVRGIVYKLRMPAACPGVNQHRHLDLLGRSAQAAGAEGLGQKLCPAQRIAGLGQALPRGRIDDRRRLNLLGDGLIAGD